MYTVEVMDPNGKVLLEVIADTRTEAILAKYHYEQLLTAIGSGKRLMKFDVVMHWKREPLEG